MISLKPRSILLISAIFRVGLILVGEWQDTHMEVRYTDVDYLVFSDAASLMASDLFVGLFIRIILKQRKVPDDLCTYSMLIWLFNPFTFTIGTRGNCEPIVCAIILWIIICLINGRLEPKKEEKVGLPEAITSSILSTGSFLQFNICVLERQSCNVVQAAFWYGLIVHFRIYPIIYALPIVIFLDPRFFRSGTKPLLSDWTSDPGKARQINSELIDKCAVCDVWKSTFTRSRILFGLISGTVFLLCTGFFFHLYGWEFLHEALLYHLTRTDARHNFSIYFYHIYLNYERELSVLEKLVSFLPQFIVQLVLILCFAKDLVFCFFVQTVAFVAFNKVITAQYFVWFFCLLPLILPWSNMKLKWKGLCCILLWMGAQTHWLLWGYLLEFKGKNVFLQLWMASLLFLAANTFILIVLIRHHNYGPLTEVTPATQTNTIKAMQSLSIRIPFNNNIRNSDLQITSIATNPPTNSSYFPKLDIIGEAFSQIRNNSKRSGLTGSEERGSEVVKPENASNRMGAVVEGESKEFVGFIVTGSDYTKDFNA
ncbi:hypothetical protein GOBAR_AA36972 [Gossypium barbadense]|uniref:GPI mannosyltransferase 1 n=1 Tax=Gossypium barbadense TaxID=3634 RepID=A0A2P5VY54_GOSBA|nr:hypothetical protein GOBAR_AA36972 [Gossypium barbadense]